MTNDQPLPVQMGVEQSEARGRRNRKGMELGQMMLCDQIGTPWRIPYSLDHQE